MDNVSSVHPDLWRLINISIKVVTVSSLKPHYIHTLTPIFGMLFDSLSDILVAEK